MNSRTSPGARRIVGVLLAAAFLFSGDLVRLHGHADGVPSGPDCAACVAGLSAAVEPAGGVAFDFAAPLARAIAPLPSRPAPALPFVRQAGSRDPPLSPPDLT